jgi:NADPH:quinone reductase-like Zn-dependent oxidoreductase
MIELKNFIETGKVTPVIDRTFPLSEVLEPIRHSETGATRQGGHYHVRKARLHRRIVYARSLKGG